MFILKFIKHPVTSARDLFGKDTATSASVDVPKVVENGLFYEKRDDERRKLQRRSTDRRDDFSWRSQIWKRTSLSQYCRRKTDRRDNERRLMMERRAADALIKS
jgi:hypothetical protein